MRGDHVEVVVDAGNEVTRSGTPVRTPRSMANWILALVEHPAADIGREGLAPGPRRAAG